MIDFLYQNQNFETQSHFDQASTYELVYLAYKITSSLSKPNPGPG